MKKVLLDMYRNEGPLALYKGLVTSLWLCTTGIVHMTCYEFLQKSVGFYTGPTQHPKLKGLIPLFTGAFSRFIATSLLYPLTTIRTRLQKRQYRINELNKPGEAAGGEIMYTGNIDCIKKILRNEGYKGFYKGLLANLLRVVPANGMFFMIYEYVNKQLSKI